MQLINKIFFRDSFYFNKSLKITENKTVFCEALLNAFIRYLIFPNKWNSSNFFRFCESNTHEILNNH